MAPPIEPWVSIYDVLNRYAPDLIDQDTGYITGDPDIVYHWEQSIDTASWMLWTLTRGRVHPEECWVEEYKTSASCRIRLRQQPLLTVVRVEAAQVCGQPRDEPVEIGYCLEDAGTINVCCEAGSLVSAQCGCKQTVIRVYYRTQSTLPPGAEMLVGWLANQLYLAGTGQKCELPQRVTSINRQGVSWSMIDPMDYLDKEKTGISQVDSWVSLAKLNYPSAQLIDPLKSQIRTSRRVDCHGAEFAADSFTSGFNVTTDLVG